MDRLRFGFFSEFKGNTPTLLFFGTRVALRSLIDVLSSTRDHTVIRLEHDPRFLSLGGAEVALSLTEDNRGGVIRRTPGGCGVHWLLPKESGEALIQKIAAVSSSEYPCHQYLDDQMGDISIMVSVGEYPDTLYPDSPTLM